MAGTNFKIDKIFYLQIVVGTTHLTVAVERNDSHRPTLCLQGEFPYHLNGRLTTYILANGLLYNVISTTF